MKPAFLIAPLLLLAGNAAAQVSTNTKALDALGGNASAEKPAARKDHRASHAHHAATSRAHAHAAAPAHGAGTPHPRIPVPTMHPKPPPPPIIAPPAVKVETHPPPPPPPVPVDPHATGDATPIPGGTQITFGADSAALNPATIAAIHAQSARLKTLPDEVAEIDAYAPGTEDDPSTPRRVSLERALAARAVMINDGIPSTRIYARALGTEAPPNGGSPDRLDLVIRPRNELPAGPDPSRAGSVPQ